jgi:hypothetical protein
MLFAADRSEIDWAASSTGYNSRINVVRAREQNLSGALLRGAGADRKNAGEHNRAKQSRWHGVPSTANGDYFTPRSAQQGVVKQPLHRLTGLR